jgi:hypothetical protein
MSIINHHPQQIQRCIGLRALRPARFSNPQVLLGKVQVAGGNEEAHRQLLLATMHHIMKLQRRRFSEDFGCYNLPMRAKMAGETSFWDEMLTISAQSSRFYRFGSDRHFCFVHINRRFPI